MSEKRIETVEMCSWPHSSSQYTDHVYQDFKDRPNDTNNNTGVQRTHLLTGLLSSWTQQLQPLTSQAAQIIGTPGQPATLLQPHHRPQWELILESPVSTEHWPTLAKLMGFSVAFLIFLTRMESRYLVEAAGRDVFRVFIDSVMSVQKRYEKSMRGNRQAVNNNRNTIQTNPNTQIDKHTARALACIEWTSIRTAPICAASLMANGHTKAK